MRIQITKHGCSVASIIAAVTMTFGVANAPGGSLSVIPTLTGDTLNEGRAITPDGQYVVGLSGSRGFLYQVGTASAINVISSDNAQSQIANGVGYRTFSGQTQLIISAMTSSGEAEYMTADGGTTWGVKRRNANWTYGQAMGAANQLGSSLASDMYYVSSRSTAQTSQLVVFKGAGVWPPPAPYNYYVKGISADQGAMNGMSASGRAVGWRGAGGTQANKQNYVLDAAASTAFFFNGLAGSTLGEAFSVSADGLTVFGRSHTLADSVNYYGYKVVNPGASQTISALPLIGDEAGSVSLQIPYGSSADGSYAVGMAYRGSERAVLWDTTDPNPANWGVWDLTSWAASTGILDGFSRLSRAYSVGQNALGELVITGVGSWSPDGGATPYTTRAFVVVIPEPGTMSLLALGVFGLLALRRRK